MSGIETVDLSGNDPMIITPGPRTPGEDYFTRSFSGQASLPEPDDEIRLATPRNKTQRDMRERIEAEFFESFKRKYKMSPNQAMIDKHIWEVELAGKAAIDTSHPEVSKLTIAHVFDNPIMTKEQLLEAIAEEVGVTNPFHRIALKEMVKDTVELRQQMMWLFGGGHGHSTMELSRWMGDIFERFLGPNNCDGAHDQMQLAGRVMSVIGERCDLSVSINVLGSMDDD